MNTCIQNNLLKLKQIKEANEIMKKELDLFEKKIIDKMNKKRRTKEREKKRKKINVW